MSDIPASNRLVNYLFFGIGGKGKHGKWDKSLSHSKAMQSLIGKTAICNRFVSNIWVGCSELFLCCTQAVHTFKLGVCSMCVRVAVKRQSVLCFTINLVFAWNRKTPVILLVSTISSIQHPSIYNQERVLWVTFFPL